MILVVGATGLVGGRITRELIQRRQEVRILVRPGSAYQTLVADSAQPVFGDLKEPASLAAALAGVETVITTASAGSRGGADTPQTVDLEGNHHLIDAARRSGVAQVVFVSALNADESSPQALPRAKAKSEAYLRASGLTYTILAPNGIMDVLLPLIVGRPALEGRPVTLVGEGLRRHSWVAARDIAAYAVAAVGHPAALNQRFIIGGPQAISWRDIVASYARALGRPIPVQTIAPGELLPGLPPAPGLAEFLSGVMAALETFDSPIAMDDLARTFGVQPTSLDEFVECAAPTA
jgi:NADH dehydrogenase